MKNKRIGIIARGLTKGGVTQFITNVLNEFNDMNLIADIVVFTDEASYAQKYQNLEIVYIKKRQKIIWDYILFPLTARRYNLDTVIYTKNVIPLTNLLFPWKKLVVVYDLGYLYPELNAYKFWDTLYMRIMMGISFRFANKIMAISKFTKSEIMKYFKVEDEKIFVNYLGVSEKYRVIEDEKYLTAVQKKYHLKKPFIFYVGSLSPRKNILRTLKAFNRVKDDLPFMFYLVSSRSWNAQNIYEYIDSHLADRVRIIENVSEDDLIGIYNMAEALIYPSLYEGFGLPILEALATRCQIITSKGTSMEEIGKEYITTANTRSLLSISRCMVNTLIVERKHPSNNSEMHLKNFSWKNSARHIIDISTSI